MPLPPLLAPRDPYPQASGPLARCPFGQAGTPEGHHHHPSSPSCLPQQHPTTKTASKSTKAPAGLQPIPGARSPPSHRPCKTSLQGLVSLPLLHVLCSCATGHSFLHAGSCSQSGFCCSDIPLQGTSWYTTDLWLCQCVWKYAIGTT